MSNNQRALFLDKDGTVTYPIFWEKKFRASRSVDEIHYYPNIPELLTQIKNMNYKIFMITNQPDVGAGKIQPFKYDQIMLRILSELKIDEIQTCTHIQTDKCKCRKPATGLVDEILSRYNIELSESWILGDRKSDIDLGLSLRIKTILVGNTTHKDEVAADTLFFEQTANALNYICSLG
jgi:D-glycero-D-manno-heptose 1,7-bisphosphate phosphatase